MKSKEDKLQRKLFAKETILTLPFGSHFELRCRGKRKLVLGIFLLCCPHVCHRIMTHHNFRGNKDFRIIISLVSISCCHLQHYTTGGPSARLEKKPTINSWERHALCDSVLSYEWNRWKFEHVIRNSMGNEIWSIYDDNYFEIWAFYK